MTKEELESRIAGKEAELQELIKADNEAAQVRQQQFAQNQKKANQLEGAIAELKNLMETE